jgi:SP family general alpha glucoside:H+ symporter-like MFS transporter
MEKADHLEASIQDQEKKDTNVYGKEGGFQASVGDAQQANISEHKHTVRQALRAYPWAVFWSLLVSMSIIMEGYDTQLIGSFFGFPAFRTQFGEYSPVSKDYQVAGKWQSALGSGPTAGCIVGATLNGWMIQRFGYKPVFMVGLILMNGFVFINFFGKTIELQTVGQVLSGIPWGIFATIGPAYASEVCPLAFRPYLTAYTNMCFAIGQFISAGVLQSLLARDDQWSYRIPWAIQWLWPAPLMVVAFFMPESPWWLARKGKLEAAEHNVKRLMAENEKPRAKNTVAMMVHTNEIELETTSGTSYFDCFKGTDLRRTEIACVIFAGQVLAGSTFAYSGTYFFEQAGMSAADAYKLALGGTAVAFVGTILSWILMRIAGRRTIYLGGMMSMCICLLLIGFLAIAKHSSSATWTQSAFCILWLFSFSLSAGPIGWAVPAEVSSTRLRSKTICLARNSYYIVQVIANVIEPYFMNPDELNWKGYTGFFWFGSAFITLVWAFFRLPETKGRTYEELDLMFAAKVPTRKFSKYHVDAYDESRNLTDRIEEHE